MFVIYLPCSLSWMNLITDIQAQIVIDTDSDRLLTLIVKSLNKNERRANLSRLISAHFNQLSLSLLNHVS